MRKAVLLFLMVCILTSCTNYQVMEDKENTLEIADIPEYKSEDADEESFLDENTAVSLEDIYEYVFKPEDAGIYTVNNTKLIMEKFVNGNGLYYLYDVDTEEQKTLCELPPTVAASGDALIMQESCFYLTDYSTDDKRVIYKIDTENAAVDIVESHLCGEDRPFIYLSKYDENTFLFTEINDSNSSIKLYDVDSDSAGIIVTSDYDRTEKMTGDMFMDTYVYNGDIYALVAQIADGTIKYVIRKYDAQGNENGKFDCEEFNKSLFQTAPLCLYGNRNYIVVRNWNSEDSIYKIEDNMTLTKIIDFGDKYRVFLQGMEYNFDDTSGKYIFMIKSDRNEAVLYALNVESGEIVSKEIKTDDPTYIYIDGGIIDKNGSMLLEYVSQLEEKYKNKIDKMYYYINEDALENIFG